MSLRFIYGRAGSGKSHYCLQDIKNRIEDGCSKPLIMLVPEQFSFQSEKNLIKAIGEGNGLRAEVLSFRRIAFRVFNEVGGITKQHMDSAGRAMLLYKIVEKNKSKLKLFSKALKGQGFVDILSDTITEMKRYNITPELMKNMGEKLEEEGLKDKLLEIALIYEEFERELHEKYIDSEDDLTLLGEMLTNSRLFKNAEIWIDEFAVFTPQQQTIIEKLLLICDRVNIVLCADALSDGMVEETDIFSQVKYTQLKLGKIAFENNIQIEKPIKVGGHSNNRFRESVEINHLEQHLLTYPFKKYEGETKDISIFKAVNKYSEVEEIARDITRICRDNNIRYREIAVVTRDLPGYESLARAIFNQYDIPYFIDEKRDVLDNPLILLITSAGEIINRSWTYEPVFRYLKVGLLDIARSDIDLLENYVLSNGIRGRRWLEERWNYRFNYNYSEEMSEFEEDIINRVNTIKDRITLPIINLKEKIDKVANAREMCVALYEFLCEINIPEKIEALVEEFKNSGELDKASEYSQIWNMIMGILDQIVEVMGSEKLTLDQFLRILTQGFGKYSIGVIPPALDQVLVGSIERLKSHEIKYLYIIGVNDGIFPRASKEEGILSDRDREELREKGMELAPSLRSRVFEEQFLVYTALTVAGRNLRLSYPIADHEGKTMRPSIIISRIKKVFPGLREYSNIVVDNQNKVDSITRPKATFKELVGVIRDEKAGIKLSPLWQDVKSWYAEREEWGTMLNRISTALTYSNEIKPPAAKLLRKLYGKEMYFSVSRLEKYVECPFAYFVQYGLKTKERKVYEMNAPDMGTFLHTVIDQFSRTLKENNMQWRQVEKDWCNEQVGIIVDSIASRDKNSIFLSSARYQYITTRFKRIVARAVWLIASHIKRSGFEPVGYEIGFGINSDFPPIAIELKSGEKINLIGRIDRVDKMEDEEGSYIRVIDYKSGNKAFKLSDVYYGFQMQLLVYLDAMLSIDGEKSEKPVYPGGVLYFKIDDPIIKSKGELGEELIEKEIMKKLKMKGLLLADAKIIKEMDREIDGSSLIIPARINKDGSLGKSSAATKEQFEHLRGHIRGKLTELCQEMADGNIAISPYKKGGNTPCSYCRFDSVCKFDPSIKENKYKLIRDKDDDEVWSLIAPRTTGGECNE